MAAGRIGQLTFGMPLTHLLPSVAGLTIGELKISSELVDLELISTCATSCCPLCRTTSLNVHSYYHRKLLDAPWALKTVRIRLRARRFYCRNAQCERMVFTERFEREIFSYTRRTQRVNNCLEAIGFASGGMGGSILSELLGMPISPSTMLRIIARGPERPFETPRVLGVDDWAFRKGHNYGTILVDLEKRQPIDLLPERNGEILKKWLLDHPGVEIISRDRATCYADGAREGAPDAVQVADRWHLLKNLGEAVQRMLYGKGPLLREATCNMHGITEKSEKEPSIPGEEEFNIQPQLPPEPVLTEAETSRRMNYKRVKTMQVEGKSIHFTAKELGISRVTVRRYRAAAEFPQRAIARTSYSSLNPYIGYLEKRWAEGMHSPKQLWRELQHKDASIQYGSVYRMTTRLFGMVRGPRDQQTRHLPKPPVLSVRKASILLSKNPDQLTDQEKIFCHTLCENSSEIQTAYPMIQEFIEMIREQHADALNPWLEKAVECEVTSIIGFAEGLKRDYDAVYAALSLPWSNGQVEGQVNRLKMIKRQMYGRAGFELLRRRVLYRARAG
jgi:transposase